MRCPRDKFGWNLGFSDFSVKRILFVSDTLTENGLVLDNQPPDSQTADKYPNKGLQVFPLELFISCPNQ